MERLTESRKERGHALDGVLRAVERSPGWTLGALGAAMLAVELAIFTSRYFLLSYYHTPLVTLGSLRVVAHGQTWTILGWAVLFALYYGAYRAAPRVASGRLLLLAALVACGLAAGYLFMYPVASSDLYDYVVRGHLVVTYHVNPFTTLPAAYPADPLYGFVYWKRVPADYGALWHAQVDLVSLIAGGRLLASLFAYKLIVLAYYLAGIPLIAGILQRLRPDHVLRGVILYSWNPLLQFEFAGNGHNDAVVIFWMLLAVLFLVRSQPLGVVVSLWAGILVKFVPILVVPVLLVAVLRDGRRSARSKAVAVAAAAIFCVVLTFAVYMPYGLHSITDTVSRLRYRDNYFGGSIPALAVYVLNDSLDVPRQAALALVALVTKLVVLAVVIWQCLRLWRLRAESGDELVPEATRAAFEVLYTFLLLAVLWFWPWYLSWLFAFAPLLWQRGYAARTVVFAASSLGIYVMSYFLGPYLMNGLHVAEVPRTLLLVMLVFMPALVASAFQLRMRARRRVAREALLRQPA